MLKKESNWLETTIQKAKEKVAAAYHNTPRARYIAVEGFPKAIEGFDVNKRDLLTPSTLPEPSSNFEGQHDINMVFSSNFETSWTFSLGIGLHIARVAELQYFCDECSKKRC